MKQRPILFSTPMVQAILEGRKTQTRRSVGTFSEAEFKSLGFVNDNLHVFFDTPAYRHIIPCPYGKPGDVLWVRETFGNLGVKYGYYVYKADELSIAVDDIKSHLYQKKWKPSIHMPKDAARIWLRITNVRVEKLNQISECDARQEGIEMLLPHYKDYSNSSPFVNTAYASFKTLWQSINGGHYFSDWSLNPWVWVIEFERTEKPEVL